MSSMYIYKYYHHLKLIYFSILYLSNFPHFSSVLLRIGYHEKNHPLFLIFHYSKFIYTGWSKYENPKTNYFLPNRNYIPTGGKLSKGKIQHIGEEAECNDIFYTKHPVILLCAFYAVFCNR